MKLENLVGRVFLSRHSSLHGHSFRSTRSCYLPATARRPDRQCYRARWTNQTICSPQKLPLV